MNQWITRSQWEAARCENQHAVLEAGTLGLVQGREGGVYLVEVGQDATDSQRWLVRHRVFDSWLHLAWWLASSHQTPLPKLAFDPWATWKLVDQIKALAGDTGPGVTFVEVNPTRRVTRPVMEWIRHQVLDGRLQHIPTLADADETLARHITSVIEVDGAPKRRTDGPIDAACALILATSLALTNQPEGA